MELLHARYCTVFFKMPQYRKSTGCLIMPGRRGLLPSNFLWSQPWEMRGVRGQKKHRSSMHSGQEEDSLSNGVRWRDVNGSLSGSGWKQTELHWGQELPFPAAAYTVATVSLYALCYLIWAVCHSFLNQSTNYLSAKTRKALDTPKKGKKGC